MAGNESLEQAMSDHSPLVYHLRFVHFSLIIASVVVFTFSLLYDQSKVDQAYSEAKELNKWLKPANWEQYVMLNACRALPKKHSAFKTPTILDNYYKDGIRKLNFTSTIDSKEYIWQLTVNPNVKFKFQCASPPLQDFYMKHRRYKENANTLGRNPMSFGYSHGTSGVGSLNLPKDVNQLRKAWNKVLSGMWYYRITGWDLDKAIIINYKDRKVALKDLVPVQKGVKLYTQTDVAENVIVTSNHFKIYKVIKPEETARAFGYEQVPKDFHLYMYVDLNKNGSTYALAIPLKAKNYHLDVLSDIVKQKKMKVAVIDKFSASFPALDSIIKEQESAKVAPALQDAIQRHVAANTTEIEMMGAKIEINSLLKVGATIILSLMLYYVINLRALVYKLRGDNQAYAVAWIGIYPDRTSYLFTIFTVIAMPFAVSIVQLVVTFDLKTISGQLISGATVFILVVVSFITLIQSHKLFAKVRRFATRVRD